MIFKKGLDRHFVSSLDKFLYEFDEIQVSKSDSQQREINKAAKVTRKRDHADYQDEADVVWENL